MAQDAQTAWRVVSVSVQGTSHVRDGKPCQDAHLWRVTPGGLLIAAVADGAGSAPHSEIGSTCAVKAAVDDAADRLRDGFPYYDEDWRSLLSSVFQTARQAVEAAAAARPAPPRDLACTLLVAVATADFIVAAQVGDGAVIAHQAPNVYEPITTPSFGEYLNETVFLTSNDALAKMQCKVQRGAYTGLAMFSDGLQMQALRVPQGTPHAPFFNPLMRFMADADDTAKAEEHLRRFLQAPRITDQTDDDLTLVLAIRT